jgi:DNA-binding PadR family transcriptional regulator
VRASVLALLAERPMHGYEIITELAERTHGMWRPSAGSVYPTLQLLEDEGLITGDEAGGKRRFTLTEAARAEQAERGETAPWDRVTDDAGSEAVAVRESLHKLVMAWKQVVSTGTDEQQRAATAVMNDARRRLYAILAEE